MAENKIGRRKWVKLWVDEWLEGTTRFEMNDSQRAFWIDLLAMAGRSRVPGVVFAGMAGDRAIGYPLKKFEILLSSSTDILQTFELFVRMQKIKMDVEIGPPTLYTIHILNWEKFQSEYHRQKKYRQKGQAKPSESAPPPKELQRELQPELQARLQPELQPRLHEDYGVEVEVEVEGEGEERLKDNTLVRQKPADASAQRKTDFESLWEAYPRKEQKPGARQAFEAIPHLNGHFAELLSGLEVWKRSEQWQEPRFIPLLKKWLAERQWQDRPARIADAGTTRGKNGKSRVEREADEAARRTEHNLRVAGFKK
jgi:hypothetical protein